MDSTKFCTIDLHSFRPKSQ